MKQEIDISQTGITHLSFSAVRDFLSDRRNFRKKWIDHDWDNTPILALLQGSAFHAGVARFWQYIQQNEEPDLEVMVEDARASIARDYDKATIKIKSRIAKGDVELYESMGCKIEKKVSESASGRKSNLFYAEQTTDSILVGVRDDLANYLNAMDHQVTPDSRDLIPFFIEQPFVAQTIDAETGEVNPFPLKMKVDLIAGDLTNQMLVIIDHKYQGSDIEQDDDGNFLVTPPMILQAAAMVSGRDAIMKAMKEHAKKEVMVEIDTVAFDIFNKKTGNFTRVPIKVGPMEAIAWSRIYRGVQQEILDIYERKDFDTAFLPNPDSLFNSDGWKEYMKDVECAVDGVEAAQIDAEEPKDEPEDYEPYEL